MTLSLGWVPVKRPSSWMPVGLVTLTSVRRSPITSRPTKTRPSARRRGATVAHHLALARGELGGDDAAADVDVGAQIVAAGHAEDGAERLAVEEEDALVACGDRGEELLHDDEAPALAGEHVDDGARVLVAGLDLDDAHPAGAVERLDDGDAAVVAAEAVDHVAIGGDQGARRPLGEVERVELLVGVAEAAGVVDEERPAAGALQDQRGVEVGAIEGRILAHEDGVDVREAELRRPGLAIVEDDPRGRRPDLHRMGDRPRFPVLDVEVAQEAVVRGVPARLCRLDEGERGVLVVRDTIERIHDEDEAHALSRGW